MIFKSRQTGELLDCFWTAPAERSGDGAFAWSGAVRLSKLLPKAVSRFACHRSPKWLRHGRQLRQFPKQRVLAFAQSDGEKFR
jgi:hypothetical protein